MFVLAIKIKDFPDFPDFPDFHLLHISTISTISTISCISGHKTKILASRSMEKLTSKQPDKEMSLGNIFPTFSLVECLSDYLSKEGIELSHESRETVINLSKPNFVSNPSKMKEGWFVKHFVTNIITKKRLSKAERTGESSNKERSWYDKTGTCIALYNS